MSGRPGDDSTVLALVSIVRASLRALRAALSDLDFSPENVGRVGNEAETVSAALGRLDRVFAASPSARPSAPLATPDAFTLDEVMVLLSRIRRHQEPDGLCSICGSICL